jgi:hypothetical protein
MLEIKAAVSARRAAPLPLARRLSKSTLKSPKSIMGRFRFVTVILAFVMNSKVSPFSSLGET